MENTTTHNVIGIDISDKLCQLVELDGATGEVIA